ncbi:hypothetical protein CUMW_073530 [Citrus unshiu]|nr:hypothetical protein CUMW_073530 [Citrus unshiu]
MMLEDNLFASHAIAGVGSVALASSLTYPLDTIKVLKQVGSGSNKQLSSLQVLNRLGSLSGKEIQNVNMNRLQGARILLSV